MNELEKIVQRMIEAGEPEENIATVIQSYNSPGKTSDPVQVESNTGSEDTDSNSVNTLSESQEENNDFEDFLGQDYVDAKNKEAKGKGDMGFLYGAIDWVSDIGRSGSAGWDLGGTLDSSLNLHNKGMSGMSESEKEELVKDMNTSLNIGRTDEMKAFDDAYAKNVEKHGGIKAFFMGWSENKTVMTQYSMQSMAMMAASLGNGESIKTALKGGAAGFGVGFAASKYGKMIPGRVGKALSTITALQGAGGGLMGGISKTLEKGFTTMDLLNEKGAEVYGDKWTSSSSEGKLSMLEEMTSNKDLYDDIKSKAVARGNTIGFVDAVTGMVTLGVGTSIGRGAAKSSLSRGTKLLQAGGMAATETAGGIVSEIGGQIAAGQDIDPKEYLLEGVADKTFTLASTVKRGIRNNPKYKINGEEMNGKRFQETVMSLDDEAFVGGDFSVENSPVMNQIIQNRQQDINIDMDINSQVNDVADRAKIIKLEREVNSLSGKSTVSSKNKASSLKQQIKEIELKYENNQDVATQDQRKQAIAQARSNKFDNAYNKNYKAVESFAKKKGLNVLDFENENDYFNAIAKNQGISFEQAKKASKLSDGAFVGKGEIFINKTRAREVGAVTVAQHEVLHPILNSLIGGIGSQGKIVNEFKKQLNSKQRKIIEKALGDQPSDTEYLNVFTDNFDAVMAEQNITQKISDFFKDQFVKLGFENINFETGDGIYNFLKEYNTSIKKGKLSERAEKAVDKAESKAKTKISDVDVADKVQYSQTSAEAQKVNDIYENTPNKTEAGFEIAMLYRGMAESVFKSLRDGSGYVQDQVDVINDNKDDMIPMMLYDKIPSQASDSKARNVLGLVQDFEKEKQKYGNVAAYINTFFKNRSKEVFKYFVPDAVLEGLNKEDGTLKTAVKKKKNTVAKEETGPVARKATSFDKLKDGNNKDFYSETIKRDVIKDVGMILIRNIGRKKISTDNIIENIEENVDKHISRTIKDQMGDISNKKGQLEVSSKYKEFINDSYQVAIKSFPLSSIKKSYGKLFKLEKLSREKTAVGKGVFKMTAPTRAEWGAHHTIGRYTTLKARQLVLAKEMAADFNKTEVSKLLTDGKFIEKLLEVADLSNVELPAIVLDQTIKDINVGLDRKIDESRSFDTTIQFSQTMYDSKQSEAVIKALKTPYAKHVYRTNYIERTNERWLVKAISQVLKASDIKDARKIAEELGKPWMAKNTVAKEKQKGLDFAIDNLHTKITGGEVTVRALNAKHGIKSIVDLNSLDGVNSARKAINYISKKLTKSEFIRGIYQGVTNPARVAGFEVNDNVGLEIKKSEATAIPEFKSNGKRNKAYYSAFKNTKDINKNVNIESTKDSFRDGNITKKDWYYGNPFNKLDDNGKKAFVKKLYDSSLEDRRILLKLADVLRKGIVDGDLTYQQVQWVLVTQFGNMVGVGKAAAGPKFLMLDKNDNVLTFKNFSDKKKDPGVLEHMIPADYIKGLVYDYVITGNKETLVAELENYATLVLPDVIDKKLREDGTQSAMGIDHKVGSKPTDNRYSGTGLRLYDVSTGKIIDTGLQYSKTEYNKSANIIKAENIVNGPPKGISVFDFDDTLAQTNSKILVTMLGGKKIKIDATEFALQSADLEAAGAKFDFSEFNKVIEGKKGPLADLALKRQGKFGSKDIFVLTARPQQAAYAIHAFLKGIGLDIPIDNITGLEDGKAQAKADWIAEKAADGYNDFYFADDAYKNVKAVQDTLNHLNLNPNVELAKIQFSKSNSDIFNDILEGTKGVKSEKRFNPAAAKAKGATRKNSWFIPPGAEDFQGLIYQFLTKGKRGELQKKFFELRLFKPFAKANAAMNRAKQAYVDGFKAINKRYPKVNEKLNQKLSKGEYFMQDAVRVYIWNKTGQVVPGMDQNEVQSLVNFVEKYSDITAYANDIINMSRDTNYIKPSEHWLDGSVASDIQDLTSKENRKKFLGEWIKNKNEIFSKENLNKIEAIYGEDYRSALEDILWRMENGTNRSIGTNKLVNNFMNWVNNSVGAIMFFNMRSAVLQTISMVNFINWSDNNPVKAAGALANFDQYIEDFSTIFNSDMLKQRRSGLQTDVSHAELAKSIRGRGNTPSALLKELLRLGFTPTQMADSFAIASGGATFYRNRIKTYVGQGLTKQQAEAQAFEDFAEISEQSQQSSRPDLISQQQAGPLGRLILAFQNTPMQYTRLIKKSILDLYNGRGDAKTHISKIAYYGLVQNLVFTALQNAIFALAFEDDEEDNKILDAKGARMANSMVDTILRGTGVYGAAVSTIKNVLLKFKQQEDKGWNADHTYTVIEFANLSPPIGSKARKLYSGIQTWKFNKEAIADYGPGIGNPIYQAFGNVVAAGTNIPLDRLFNKINNLKATLNSQNQAWQRFANFLGWNTWDVGSVANPKLEKLKNKKRKKKRSSSKTKDAYEAYKKRKKN